MDVPDKTASRRDNERGHYPAARLSRRDFLTGSGAAVLGMALSSRSARPDSSASRSIRISSSWSYF